MTATMEKYADIGMVIAGIALLAISAICFLLAPRKLTYLEYRWCDDVRTISVDWSGQTSTAISYADESGNAPYEIMESVELDLSPGSPIPQMAALCDKSGQVLAEMGVEIIAEDPQPSIQFRIPYRHRPSDVDGCYFVFHDADGSPSSVPDIASCTWSGGSREFFWRGLALFGIAFAVIYLFHSALTLVRKKHVYTDAWCRAMVVAAVSFAIMSVMASEYNPTIMDENDNIIGGFLEAGRGSVLYRDYISQHMPFVYWLCGLFVRLGARSVGQFRLLFVLTTSLVWGGLYLRHSGRWYASAVAAFAFLSMPMAYCFIGQNAGQILSDNVQATAMTVLFLELMAYYDDNDHEMGIGRAMVVGTCVFAAIGSAFLAAFAVFACAAAFAAEEVRYQLVGRKRYVPLAVCILLPWVVAVIYLSANGALEDAYNMAFRFNLEVYPKYGLPGGNFVEPLYSGLANCGNLLIGTWTDFWAGTANLTRIIESSMVILTVILLISSFFHRGIVRTLGIFFFIETQAARQAVQFHSIMLWYVVFMFILTELLSIRQNREAGKITARDILSAGILPALYLLVLFVVFTIPYFRYAGSVVSYRIAPVSAAEIQAVNLTNPDDELFIEGGMLEGDYVLYKERYPATRLCWTLPWYYEWYGEETVRILKEKGTQVVLYKMNPVVWGVESFAWKMDALIASCYTRIDDMDLFMRTDTES
ncbi:MAG: hypothetical protein Q4A32_08885 [Lachnospiraceae bacterium]|nr:hypothetical protein [Lachnospiraceae bacterium]